MAIKPGQGLAKWEIATLRKIVGCVFQPIVDGLSG